MRRPIIEKNMLPPEDDAEVVVKGWLYRELSCGWVKQRRFWFILTPDSLDYYSSPEPGGHRLSSLVLTSLCTILWPDKHTYRETGYWSLCVYGRKHCYRLFTKHFNEAVHWACAIQKVISSKAPVETPTQLLIRDIEENKFNPEVVEHIYQHNPILTYTQSPLYAPLLPFPYGSLEHTYVCGNGYAAVREEAVRMFNCLQQLESSTEPIPIMQGVLQTCLDLRPLRDEIYCQLIKQTSTHTQTQMQTQTQHLRYWQLLTCVSCTFLPNSSSILKYLHFHLKRVKGRCVDMEVESFAWFISQAVERTCCRECVPSWEEMEQLMRRQELLCVVHYPGAGSRTLRINSHTTATEVVKRMVESLGLQDSQNTFALFEQTACWEQVVGGSTIIADVLTRFQNLSSKDLSKWHLCFKLYCLLDTDSISVDSMEYLLLYEQCHELVVRGQLPIGENDLQSLAALRLQAQLGDFSPLSPCPALEQLYPQQSPTALPATAPGGPPGCHAFPGVFLTGALWRQKRQQEEQERARTRAKEEGVAIMAAIVEHWRGLAGYSRTQSITAYLNIARQWSGFGSTLYEVDFYVAGSLSRKLLLGVAASAISLYHHGETEAVESFPIDQICSYGVSDSRTFRITAGERDLLFQTSKLTEILQLMNAYFSASQRHLGKKENCIAKETHRKFPPPLLELPSHSV
ncbi:pleckstrin homology domain-containing family H member 3 isoform X2 [Denticeps clupeoides]|nr:pleckstrin homology domain-containing family H member 3 isoform X2 [Denticeps clupeoides]